MSDSKFSIDWVSAFIAVVVALTFAYGFVYHNAFYYEFGLSWYVESIAISNIALSGAATTISVAAWAVLFYFLVSISQRICRVLAVAYVLCVILWLACGIYFYFRLSVSVSETLNMMSGYISVGCVVAGLGFGLLALAIEMKKHAMAFLCLYSILQVFFYFMPSMSAKEDAVNLITQNEGVAPEVVSGKYVGWVVLGVNDGQAVLVGFEEKNLKWTSKIAFAPLDQLDIKTPKYAIYQKNP